MACSCRTSALRMFVRSLSEVYAPPNNNAFARRTAWHDTRGRLSVRAATRLGVSCRQLHASTRARSSAQSETEAVDEVSPSLEGTAERQAPSGEEGSSAQQQQLQQVVEEFTAESHVIEDPEPRATLPEDDKLFEIKLRSKNARKKARKYPDAAGPDQATEEQVVQVVQEGQEIQEEQEPQGFQWVQRAREAPDVQEVQEAQKKEPVRVTKVFVDETQGSKKRRPLREGWDPKDDGSNEITHKPPPPKEEKRRDTRPLWAIQKEALKTKFPEGWQPRKRLSPDALAGIRALHQQYPDIYTTVALSQKFEVSPEAIRRILKARWEPAPQEEENRQQRWFNRGLKIWERYAELGKEPPRRWREAGVQRKTWNGRRWEEDNEEDEDEQGVDEEKLKRLRAQLKLARSLM